MNELAVRAMMKIAAIAGRYRLFISFFLFFLAFASDRRDNRRSEYSRVQSDDAI
jgi:hypothetical protein